MKDLILPLKPGMTNVYSPKSREKEIKKQKENKEERKAERRKGKKGRRRNVIGNTRFQS